MVAHADAKTGTHPVKENSDGKSAPTEHEQRHDSPGVEKPKSNTVGPIYLLSFSSVDEIATHETAHDATSLIGFGVHAREYKLITSAPCQSPSILRDRKTMVRIPCRTEGAAMEAMRWARILHSVNFRLAASGESGRRASCNFGTDRRSARLGIVPRSAYGQPVA